MIKLVNSDLVTYWNETTEEEYWRWLVSAEELSATVAEERKDEPVGGTAADTGLEATTETTEATAGDSTPTDGSDDTGSTETTDAASAADGEDSQEG